MLPRLILCDASPIIIDAWQAYFGMLDNVEIVCDTIAAQEADALVVPVNSFGRLDGGLDQQSLDVLGGDVQRELQSIVAASHDGELLVGQAEAMLTPDAQFPILICAPTMRVPQNLSRTVNAYLSMRAALITVRDFNAAHGDMIATLLVPPLAATNGLMPPLRAARQMRAAYDAIVYGLPAGEDISLDAGVDGDDRFTVRSAEARPPV